MATSTKCVGTTDIDDVSKVLVDELRKVSFISDLSSERKLIILLGQRKYSQRLAQCLLIASHKAKELEVAVEISEVGEDWPHVGPLSLESFR